MTKQTGKLYDPQIPPERVVLALFEAELKNRKGIKKTTRGPGEYYLATCTCNQYVIDSEWNKIAEFENAHFDH